MYLNFTVLSAPALVQGNIKGWIEINVLTVMLVKAIFNFYCKTLNFNLDIKLVMIHKNYTGYNCSELVD